MTRPTLADVARSADVSVSTASLAFSGAGPIAGATREKVLAAAERLGYAGPNPLGRQLRSGRSGIVGVLLGKALGRSFREPVAAQTLDGLVSTLAELGLGVLLLPSGRSDTDSPTAPLTATAAMDVAVLLWGSYPDDADLSALRRRGIPVINVEGPAEGGVATVAIADDDGFAQLGRHLVDLGHRDVAVVALPFGADCGTGFAGPAHLQQSQNYLVGRRLDGLRSAGVEPTAVYQSGASTVEEGRAAGLAVLDRADRPTAVVAQSDVLAAGVVLAARDLGLDVPGDVSVTGFDGVDVSWLAPSTLTTVAQPLAAKGAAVGRAIEALLAGEQPQSATLAVELKIGTTTGPAPAG